MAKSESISTTRISRALLSLARNRKDVILIHRLIPEKGNLNGDPDISCIEV